MIKIAYITSTLEASGPVNILFNIIKYLDKKKFKITIYTLSEERENSRIKDFINQGCNIKKIEISNAQILGGIIKKFENILKIDEIDILHSHCFRSTLVLSAVSEKLDLKKMATLHANIHEDYLYQFGFLKGYIMEKLYFNSLKKIKFKIACSKNIRKTFPEIFKNINYIQNGVDLECFQISNIEKKEIRKKLNLDLDKKYFISVGSLCERKDPFFIAKEFTRLNIENCELIFLGEGKEKEKIKKLKNDKIKLLGKVLNVKEYLYATDYFISASNSEGLPNSVIEALAMKLPVILSKIPSHQEIFDLNKNCGFIFEKNIENNLGEAIEKILERNYDEVSKEAYQIVEDNLNAKKMSNLYRNYYLEYINLNGEANE